MGPNHGNELPKLTYSEKKRFWSKVKKGELENDCWIWVGASFNGYGRFLLHYRNRLAHRVMASIMDIPVRNVTMIHKCDNKLCVNPNHVIPSTQKENIADCLLKGRGNRPKGKMHWNFGSGVFYGKHIQSNKEKDKQIAL